MTAQIDLYYSFRSPYSYLSTKGAQAVAESHDVAIRLRTVLPLAIRKPEYFNPANMKRAKYVLADWARRAEMLGMPHAWPDPDPVVQDLSTFKIAEEQPLIFPLVCLGVEAERRGKGLPFAVKVSGMIFGGVKNWNRDEILGQALRDIGLDLNDMRTTIGDMSDHLAEVERNQADQDAAGHDGVPLFVYNNEAFWGHDRIDSLVWQLEKDGR